jgi:hypothetical protein
VSSLEEAGSASAITGAARYGWRDNLIRNIGFHSNEHWRNAVSMIRLFALWILIGSVAVAISADAVPTRGQTISNNPRPAHFPHRIWAACDFEARTPDYGWFGPGETNNIPKYPGNATALGVGSRPYQNFSGVMTGINPVPGPRMGKENHLFLRYFLRGATNATFQHFSLMSEDNQHINVSGLTEGKWTELDLNFTRDARRNDGNPQTFGNGERMDDFKVFVGKPAQAASYQLLLDDVIFYANDPALPPEKEPFPKRVIFLAAFDTGPKEKYWPGDFELVEQPPAGSYWRTAKSVPRKDGKAIMVRLQIEPRRQVGAHTKVRFRYHLTGATAMTVQVFDTTIQDNRHVNLRDLKTGDWTTTYVNFTRDSRRNDSTRDTFRAGHKVDDLFFFVTPDSGKEATLFLDEVVLFDAGMADASK